MKLNNWKQIPERPIIHRGEIHLWRAMLDKEIPERFWNILSTDERVRALRLRDSRAAQRFIVARGILRIILSRYLGKSPKYLTFSYGVQGKPELANNSDNKLLFNLSHTRGLAVFAISRSLDVGVDIEEIRPISDLDAITTNFFSSIEQDEMRTMPSTDKLNSFFTLWTCKEAILKAEGSGLTHLAIDMKIDLRQLKPQMNSMRTVLSNGSHYHLALFTPAKGYLGAMACFG